MQEMNISSTQCVGTGPRRTGGEGRLRTLPVMGKQCGTQGTPVPYGIHRVLLPTKTSQAFSQFPDGSSFIVFPYVFNGVGLSPVLPRCGYIWWCLVVYSIVYMLLGGFFFERTGGRWDRCLLVWENPPWWWYSSRGPPMGCGVLHMRQQVRGRDFNALITAPMCDLQDSSSIVRTTVHTPLTLSLLIDL